MQIQNCEIVTAVVLKYGSFAISNYVIITVSFAKLASKLNFRWADILFPVGALFLNSSGSFTFYCVFHWLFDIPTMSRTLSPYGPIYKVCYI